MFAVCEQSRMEKLSAYLKATKTTQSAFAARVGTSKSHLCDILNHRRRPGLDLAAAIEAETQGAVPVGTWAARHTPEQARP